MAIYVGEHEAKSLVHKLRRHQPLVHCNVEGLDQLTEELAQTVIPDGAEDNIPLKLNAVSAANRETGQQYKISFGRIIYIERIRHDSFLEQPYGKQFTAGDDRYFDLLMPRVRACVMVVDGLKQSDQRFSLLARLRWEENGNTFTKPILITGHHNSYISGWEYAHKQTSRGLLRAIPGIGPYL